MILRLLNGYPFPYPANLTSEEQDEISHEAGNIDLAINGVRQFDWLHTVTVDFESQAAFYEAQKLTGWSVWGGGPAAGTLTLEAPTSDKDGYDHPAIIVKDKAFCGFILE